MMKQAGVSPQTQQATTSDFLTEMLKTTQPNLDFIKQETQSPMVGSPSMEGIEDGLEDSTLLGNDPMISLSSPAVEQHSRRSSGAVSMEEAAEMLGWATRGKTSPLELFTVFSVYFMPPPPGQAIFVFVVEVGHPSKTFFISLIPAFSEGLLILFLMTLENGSWPSAQRTSSLRSSVWGRQPEVIYHQDEDSPVSRKQLHLCPRPSRAIVHSSGSYWRFLQYLVASSVCLHYGSVEN